MLYARGKRARGPVVSALALALTLAWPYSQADAEVSCPGDKPASIVVNASGGAMANAMRKAFTDDFETIHGIEVIDTSPADIAKLKAMVTSGNVEWAVTEIGGQNILRAVQEGLLEPIDYDIVDISGFPETVKKNKKWFAKSAYATVLGYSTEAFPDDHPQSWADFWDVEKYPGPRSLRDDPADNLEYALLADGVAPEDLYPLDVDRAFRKLDEIAPHITVWWTSGQQPAQLLLDGEVVLASGWNGRFYNLIQDGAPLDIEWSEGMMKLSAYGIPKGAPDACWGQHYLQVMTDPKRQAVYAEEIGYPGLHLDSPQYVDKKLAPYLPTAPDNIDKLIWSDLEWWTEHGAEVKKRWTLWKLSHQ
ncbi:ABC transporter substrate-binding protein [Kaustia mangrovi]|uniref:ABC transporter substrate-binding protein n=1 Tax=Kaustia mangrovi TaxID=2593653 RepID=A0A7S8C349_9HYPH|nr:ABC transporter substrate-binding protein [Kaustia mangrovi]QPC42529.1 ABC transporter substrate-binding protein [Kaustia mangrovi]